MNHVLAIDIGGTKLAAALVDASGSVLRSGTRPTPGQEVMAALRGLIEEVTEGGPEPGAVGIGCAGPLDLAAGTVSPVNMPSWRGFPLRDEVRKVTGLPTVLAGDAQCMALGEHWLGAGQETRALLGIVVSTGIGGGLVVGGTPLLGPTGNAGHVGHMSVDPYGERCECGGRGCVERYASGPNMARWALENGWTPGRASTGDPVVADARTLAGDAAAGDPVAVAAFERGARALAGMIASTAAAVEITTVVVGGGVSQAGPVLFGPLEAALDDVGGLGFVRAVEVRPTTLGVRAGLAGAAKLAWDYSRSAS
ncbi:MULTISPECIES: ROK family protein [Nonomuraea]|jgi:glucokinase|uniref:ROK family protein n=1 Tax=Nonomuraea ferruginea TaxID=46174 RepID=A0ABT4SXH5_9ACTN|nr:MULTISPECIES: ROK family protein [Nonomuraea]MDA0641934.1 ROK family protein [Nonomuraea ferruginea]TXK35932.1 ROK family protein [Nonomuraea sp. C10]